MKRFCLYLSAISIALLLLCSSSSAQNESSQWNEAADLYKTGKYAEAAVMYESFLLHPELYNSADIYYNLGNCYYRGQQKSLAILNLERAIAIDPWHMDARYNLRTIKDALGYQIEDKRGLFIRFNALVLQWVHTADFLVLGLLALGVMLISGIFWIRNNSKNVPFMSFPRFEMIFLAVIFLTLAGSKMVYDRNYQEAIVLRKDAEVRFGPSLDNQSLMKLGEGLKVFIVDERSDWSRVVTWNGETGWLKNSDMGKVKV